MTVREQLRAAYERSGLTQIMVAEDAGVSERTVWNALHTHKNIGIENFVAICAAVRMSYIEVPRR